MTTEELKERKEVERGMTRKQIVNVLVGAMNENGYIHWATVCLLARILCGEHGQNEFIARTENQHSPMYEMTAHSTGTPTDR